MSRRQQRTPEEEVRDGSEARRFQADPAFQRAIAELREQCIERWQAATSVAERELEWSYLQAVNGLADELNRLALRGEYAARQQERDQR